MSPGSQAVFQAALAPPPQERAALAQVHLDSLSDEENDDLHEEQFLAELDRRRAEAQRGEAGAIPWSQLRHP